MKINFNICKTIVRYISKSSAQSVPKVVQNVNKPPFCKQYWNLRLNNNNKPIFQRSVSLHEKLNGINHHFISSPHPKDMNLPAPNCKLTPRKMISKTDFEFKILKPQDKELTVYRCIGEKPDFFSEYKLYQKRLNIKKGDIINMREYAYCTSDRSYAEVYLPNRKGILYEIIIPKGSRISEIGDGVNNEVVFPRSSKFKCLEVTKVKNDKDDYLHVKLEYIKPEE